ncbi:BMP family ABC transporter substrate-binding protein [Oceanobacillus piezotolerans]|uniref:BMP family ABC transporter substrate-binding protein n=1 Tax=Oceanobacillus piezotolerans TaxID=2448030 RepID=A0A498D9R7_9BACI|nr:BMP family ABC transporter substrate-binding protein [Oceanobacillus piezotolerans]RLL45371.1 BMP family ABC transporter substrate-binding protein [Oceanobacillus piezotolerans]
MNNRSLWLITLILGLGLFLAACGQAEEPTTTESDTNGEAGSEEASDASDTSDYQVAMVTDIGGVDDKSFNQSSWEGIQAWGEENGLEKGAGFDYAQSNEKADYMPNLTRFVRDEYNLIFGIGFELKEDVQTAAEQYPDTNFALVDDIVDAPNAASITFKEEQGSFLVGVAAALKTNTDKIGFVGGVDSPLIKKFESGYIAGAKSINPDIEVDVQYAESFADPAKGKLIAANMYDNNVDIIYHASGATGNGVFNQAKDMKQNNDDSEIWVIGVDRDQHDEGAIGEHNVTLTSMVKRVDVAVQDVINQGVDGKFPGGEQLVYGIEEDGISIATTNEEAMTDEIITAVEEWEAKILNGEVEVPTTGEELDSYLESL